MYFVFLCLFAVSARSADFTDAPSRKTSRQDTQGSLTPGGTKNPEDSREGANVPVYVYEINRSYPHDRNAYTQGLVYENGVMYEGTGIRGQSEVRKLALETGEVLQSRKLADSYFGEGLTIYGKKLIQLTWQSNVGFVYDKESFKLLQEFSYPTEGWGITFDGKRLVMSDGTSTLHFLDPKSFVEVARIEVHNGYRPVNWLNELEYVRGEIFANVWQTDFIARIAPRTGQVVGWIDLRGLLNPREYTDRVDVLNGIAYDSQRNRLFVTGKLWPRIFEIRLVPVEK